MPITAGGTVNRTAAPAGTAARTEGLQQAPHGSGIQLFAAPASASRDCSCSYMASHSGVSTHVSSR